MTCARAQTFAKDHLLQQLCYELQKLFFVDDNNSKYYYDSKRIDSFSSLIKCIEDNRSEILECFPRNALDRQLIQEIKPESTPKQVIHVLRRMLYFLLVGDVFMFNDTYFSNSHEKRYSLYVLSYKYGGTSVRDMLDKLMTHDYKTTPLCYTDDLKEIQFLLTDVNKLHEQWQFMWLYFVVTNDKMKCDMKCDIFNLLEEAMKLTRAIEITPDNAIDVIKALSALYTAFEIQKSPCFLRMKNLAKRLKTIVGQEIK